MSDLSQKISISNRISRRKFIARSAMAGVAVGFEPHHAVSAAAGGGEPHQLKLLVTGNTKDGYGVTLMHRGEPVARHNGGGEFSAIFHNAERSQEDSVINWKAQSWSGDSNHLVLDGVCTLKNSNATVYAQAEYTIINRNVVRKVIRLRQEDMFLLFYQITNRLEPAEAPAKFWSFDQTDCRGGALREYFPVAGFRTRHGVSVGLLTDAGHRNQWSRVIRRDGKPVKPAARKIPDANLYALPQKEQRAKNDFFVQQTFGEALVQVPGENLAEKLPLPPVASWIKRGDATLNVQGEVATISTSNSLDGILIPISAPAGNIYSLRVQYRSPQPMALEVLDIDEQLHKLQEISLYNDSIPESPAAFSEFRTEIYIPSWTGSGGALFLSLPPSEQATERAVPGDARTVEVRGLEMSRLKTQAEPYHRLQMDQQIEKTVFIFVDDNVPDTIRSNRLASQVHLADGLGFRGGDTEKILYADLMMLCWNADTEDFRPIVAPSIWYSAAGEMYLRDSFFALNGIHDRELNQGVFNLWAENQGMDGAINTLVEPNMANLERKSNDSTPLWLMWAFLNRRRFGANLPAEKIKKAAQYCLKTFDPHADGICWAQFVIGQLDVISYPQGTSELCENQGLLAVTLRVIKELGIPDVSAAISEQRIKKAEDAYRSYYDCERKFIKPARNISDAIGFADIFPEYLSLWLFNRKILTDEMVVNHLDRMPVMMPRQDAPYPDAAGTVRPIFIGLPEGKSGWAYFTEKWHPMVSDSFAAGYARGGMDGVYYNGGSWMRIEICGYVTGMLHGWKKYKAAIANRLWAEINVFPDFPTSQEYLATSATYPFYGYHRVFAWNAFIFQALEQAGLRTKDMDPGHAK